MKASPLALTIEDKGETVLYAEASLPLQLALQQTGNGS